MATFWLCITGIICTLLMNQYVQRDVEAGFKLYVRYDTFGLGAKYQTIYMTERKMFCLCTRQQIVDGTWIKRSLYIRNNIQYLIKLPRTVVLITTAGTYTQTHTYTCRWMRTMLHIEVNTSQFACYLKAVPPPAVAQLCSECSSLSADS
jgi:hypothetical protein